MLRRTSWAFALLLPATPLFALQGSPRLVLEPVAELGDPAPGTGLLFEHFGTVDFFFGTDLRLSLIPNIDHSGDFGFHAILGDDGIPGGVFSVGDAGLFLRSDGVIQHVLGPGDPAPIQIGQTPGTGTFVNVGGAPFITDSGITFTASAEVCDDGLLICNKSGLWTTRHGPVELLLMDGQHLPGMPPDNSAAFFTFDVPDGESIIADVNFRVDGSLTGGDGLEGFWRDRGNGLELVAIVGQQAPGLPAGVTFADHQPSFPGGPFRDWFPNRNGDLVLMSFLDGPGVIFGVASPNDEALFVERNGALELLVREGDPAPCDAPDSVFGSTGLHSLENTGSVPPHMNDDGDVLFGAIMNNSQYTHWRTVWTDRSGQLECIAKGVRIPVGGVLPQADQAPGFPEGWDFSEFLTGFINNNDHIALWGFVDNQTFVDGQFFDPGTITELGIWWDVPGELTLVAGETLPVPTLPGATFTFVTLVRLEEDFDTLWYFGGLEGPGINFTNDIALFRVDADGTQHMLLREGDLADIGGDKTDLRTIDIFGVMGGDHVTDDGQRGYEVFFTDGTYGLYTAPSKPTTQTYGCANPEDSLVILDGLPSIGSTVTLGVDNPLGTQAAGSLPFVSVSLFPDPAFPCGTLVPGLGMGGPGVPGEILISLAGANPFLMLSGPPWAGPGSPAPVALSIPDDIYLAGRTIYAQGLLVDPTLAFGVRLGLTEAVELRVGP